MGTTWPGVPRSAGPGLAALMWEGRRTAVPLGQMCREHEEMAVLPPGAEGPRPSVEAPVNMGLMFVEKPNVHSETLRRLTSVQECLRCSPEASVTSTRALY